LERFSTPSKGHRKKRRGGERGANFMGDGEIPYGKWQEEGVAFQWENCSFFRYKEKGGEGAGSFKSEFWKEATLLVKGRKEGQSRCS